MPVGTADGVLPDVRLGCTASYGNVAGEVGEKRVAVLAVRQPLSDSAPVVQPVNTIWLSNINIVNRLSEFISI
jgi:hypothetical protein